jgi:hypothetical protein
MVYLQLMFQITNSEKVDHMTIDNKFSKVCYFDTSSFIAVGITTKNGMRGLYQIYTKFKYKN